MSARYQHRHIEVEAILVANVICRQNVPAWAQDAVLRGKIRLNSDSIMVKNVEGIETGGSGDWLLLDLKTHRMSIKKNDDFLDSFEEIRNVV